MMIIFLLSFSRCLILIMSLLSIFFADRAGVMYDMILMAAERASKMMSELGE